MANKPKVIVNIGGQEAYRGEQLVYNKEFKRAVKIESSEMDPTQIGKILIFDVISPYVTVVAA